MQKAHSFYEFCNVIALNPSRLRRDRETGDRETRAREAGGQRYRENIRILLMGIEFYLSPLSNFIILLNSKHFIIQE